MSGDIEEVTRDNLDDFIVKFTKARGGLHNQDTESEASFFFVTRYAGAFTLYTGSTILWIGAQNCSARISKDGRGAGYPSIRVAVRDILEADNILLSRGMKMYYNEDCLTRLIAIHNHIKACKDDPSFLIYSC